jgi:hypothetical protein
MSKLSPKPWSVHPHTHGNGERSWEIQHGKDGEVVCNLDAPEQIEDAHLISAARELFEELQYIVKFIETLPVDCMGISTDKQTGEAEFAYRDEWLHRARAAISKANGGGA